MDDRQRQRIDGAAQEFADALVAAYRTTSDSTAAAQQLGAQQIEYFFDTVMNNLRTQAEGTSQITRQLATQQELAREATRELARVSTDNYMDFLDSVFSFYHGGASRTRRRAEEAQRQIEAAEARAQEAERSTRAAQRRFQKTERSAKEAERRAEQAERRAAEEAERSKSEAESRGGDQAGEEAANADALRRPQSKWVRTSGRSKVRGRNTRSRSRGRSSRRR
jgi:hypothetical protein